MATKAQTVTVFVALRDDVYKSSQDSAYTVGERADWQMSSILIGLAVEAFNFSSASNDSPGYDTPVALCAHASVTHGNASSGQPNSVIASLAANRVAVAALKSVTPAH